jgi:RNA polymerase sigma factor (sigma-70 family)
MTQAAFLDLVVPIEQKLFRFACHFLQDEEDARDAVQDAIVKIWENRAQLEQATNPEAWCMRVTKNTVLDRLKYNSYRETVELIHATDSSTTDQQVFGDIINRVMKIIHGLPDKSRLLIRLRDIEGFAYSEIAEIMEISVSEVKIGIFRARQSVRGKMQKLDAYGS